MLAVGLFWVPDSVLFGSVLSLFLWTESSSWFIIGMMSISCTWVHQLRLDLGNAMVFYRVW